MSIRGGFTSLPVDLDATLRQHLAVLAAAVMASGANGAGAPSPESRRAQAER
ncbi:MAG TPA: hypothetical protein VGE47_03335 [Burkholderiaceae bacterium]